MRALNDPMLTARLANLWGEVPSPGGGNQSRILAQWRSKLSPESISRASPAKGRILFQTVCAGCHKLNGEGGAIGPDLTGSNRDNLEYLLENILFPSATVADAYRQTILKMKDGRTLAGVVTNRSGATLSLQTGTESLSLDRSEIAGEETSSLSLMPEGLLDALGDAGARDLFVYLMTKDFSALK